MRIMIVDDHPVTRDGLRAALTTSDEVEIVGEAASGEQAVHMVKEVTPEVIFMDVRLPGISGIEATRQIMGIAPDTKVILFTVEESRAALADAMRAGVSGYLLKDMDHRRLPQTIRAVTKGETALPRALVTRLVAQFRDPAPSWRSLFDGGRGPRLTSREWQILKLTQEKLTTSQIARRLSLSPATVRSHRAHVIRKLRATQEDEVGPTSDSGE